MVRNTRSSAAGDARRGQQPQGEHGQNPPPQGGLNQGLPPRGEPIQNPPPQGGPIQHYPGMKSNSSRCAACKHLRRRCPSDCIFAPYFPSNNPRRFAYVHKIYGASNVGKILHDVPVECRGQAAETLWYEASCRIKNPVYGIAGMVSVLHQQLNLARSQLATVKAQLAAHHRHCRLIANDGQYQSDDIAAADTASLELDHLYRPVQLMIEDSISSFSPNYYTHTPPAAIWFD